jgi:hypothetical protein
MFLSFMNMLDLSSCLRIAHKACYWRIFLLYYIQVLCQYRLCKADHAYLTYPMLQRQLNYLNGRKFGHRKVYASYISYVGPHLVLYRKHVHSHDFVWLLLVAFTILLYIIVYIRKFESRVKDTDGCASWTISNGVENFVLQALQF